MNAKELHIVSSWFAEGKEVERISTNHEWKKFTYYDLCCLRHDTCDFSHFRLKPAPVKRMLRVDELPFPFCICKNDGKKYLITGPVSKEWTEFHAEESSRWLGLFDDLKQPYDLWNSFEVEEKS